MTETRTPSRPETSGSLPLLPPEFADLDPQPGDWLTDLYGPDWDLCPLREEL